VASAIANASPLILLSRGGHLKLLRSFADRVLVPLPVWSEISRKGSEDVTVKAIEETRWFDIVLDPPVPDYVAAWGLGRGEAAVLALAISSPGCEAILDDLAARKCAAVLETPVRGTVGIVLAAKRRGLIAHARPVLEDLIRGGLYLSARVLEEALKRVGE
jgi:predicted nucleic acid-binding protein